MKGVWMKKLSYSVVSALMLTLGLSGCAPDESDSAIEEVSACVVKNMTKAQVTEAGFNLTTKQDFQLFPDSALSGCKDGWKWKMNSALSIQKLMPNVGSKLMYSADFRYGMYGGMAGPRAPADQQKAFGEIGIQLEKDVAAKAGALSCGYAGDTEIALLTKIDYPFAVASLGYYGKIGDVSQSEKMAKEFLQAAQKYAPFRMGDYTCERFSKEDFKAHADSLLQFYQAKHKWAPGCGLVQSGMDLTLKCGMKPKD